MKYALSFVMFVLLCNAGHAIDLYIVAGQSNAVGALGSFGLPPEVQNPNPVPFWYHVTAGAQHLDGYQPSLTPMWSTGGPELAFADSLQERGDDFGVVKVAINGSSLQVEWNHDLPESWSHTLVDKIELALQTPDSRIAGMLWIQGEGDAVSWDRAFQYGDRLVSFSNVLFEEFGEFPIYYNQLNAGVDLAWKDLLRSEQSRVNGGNLHMINVDDVPIGPDKLHYGQLSMVDLGRRFASVIPVDPLAQWKQSYGVDADFDLTGDGVTDGEDFLHWQRGDALSPLAVPEPDFLYGTLALFLATFLGPTRRR